MWSKRSLIVSAVVLVSLSSSVWALTVDQSQTKDNYGFWFEAGVVRWQEFIPTLHTVGRVDLLLEKKGNPGNAIVEIRTQSGAKLAAATIAASSVPSKGWVAALFNSPVTVSPGGKYRIYVRASAASPSPTQRYFWRGSTASSYTSSCKTDVSQGWPSYDYAFRTWGDVVGSGGSASKGDFFGVWENNDANTSGMTRLILGCQGSKMTVHGFGKCHPTDCDWGTITASYTGNPFKAVYNHGFKTDTLTIRLTGPDTLHVQSVNVFHDGTNRDYVADYYLHRVNEPQDFVGTWENDDTNTRGMTRLILGFNGCSMTVHGFGKCHPTDCDWGTITASYTGNPFTAVYNHGFMTATLTIRLTGSNALHVQCVNVFHDGTNRDYVADYYFHRASQAQSFVGVWQNNDANTSGMTRLILGCQGSLMTVHGFGKCHPTDCDWGTITAPYTGNPFMAVYNHGFKTNTLTIHLTGPNALHVNSVNVFHDGTNRDYVADYYLHRVTE